MRALYQLPLLGEAVYLIAIRSGRCRWHALCERMHCRLLNSVTALRCSLLTPIRLLQEMDFRFVSALFAALVGLRPCATLSPHLTARPTSRRLWLICGTAWTINLQSCEAFSNALPEAVKYADRPKRRGPKPKDLGLKLRSEVNSNTP